MKPVTKEARRILIEELGFARDDISVEANRHGLADVYIFRPFEEKLARAEELGKHFSMNIGTKNGVPAIMFLKTPGREGLVDYPLGVHRWEVTWR